VWTVKSDGDIAMRTRRPWLIAGLTTTLCAGVTVLAAPSHAADGTVSGTVFQDYNLNGALDFVPVVPNTPTPVNATANDVGVPGVTVNAFDASGALVKTTTTSTDPLTLGQYTLAITGAQDSNIRVEVVPPAGYVPGPHGTGAIAGDTTTQFVTMPTTGVDVALAIPNEYAPAAPPILNTVQIAAIGPAPEQTGVGVDPPFADQTQASLVRSAWSDRGDASSTAPPPPPITEATAAQTGSVWGLDQLDETWAFTATLFKRHARLGPPPTNPGPDYNPLGELYLTHLGTNSANANATPWVTIPQAGTNPRTNEPAMSANDWYHDYSAYLPVGTIGLGGLALSPDHRSIYVINLARRSMWRVPFTLTGPGNSPVAGAPTEILLPLNLPTAVQGCDQDWVRPFGITTYRGAEWVTLTCTGPTAAAAPTNSNLRGYLYRYDVATDSFASAPYFEFPLFGYTRGQVAAGFGNGLWTPWLTSTVWQHGSGANFSNVVDPQPLLSDVAFHAGGEFSIGIKDRFGDMGGEHAGSPIQPVGLAAEDGTRYDVISGGDTQRVCPAPGTGVLTLEAGGKCGGRTGAEPGSGTGPGNATDGFGEFYTDDWQSSHRHVSLAGLLQVPGFAEMVNTDFDPNNKALRFRAQGYRFLRNVDGNDFNGAGADPLTNFRTLLDVVTPADSSTAPPTPASGPLGSFGKGSSLGDLQALIGPGPIEIGNRVWLDANNNGIQDPGETPLAGVTVNLYAVGGTVPITHATTDGNGDYFFSDGPDPDPVNNPTSEVYGIVGLVPGGAFTLRLDDPANYTGTGPLVGLGPTLTNTGNGPTPDSNDSDGVAVNGFSQAAVIAPGAGTSDHTFDFGFVTVPVGPPPVNPPPLNPPPVNPPPGHHRPHGPGYPCLPGDYCDPGGHGGGDRHGGHHGDDGHDGGDHHRRHHDLTPRQDLTGCGCADPRHPERCRHDKRHPNGDDRRDRCCFEPRRHDGNDRRRDCPARRPVRTCDVADNATDPTRPRGC
jgi:hypothetical protein